MTSARINTAAMVEFLRILKDSDQDDAFEAGNAFYMAISTYYSDLRKEIP